MSPNLHFILQIKMLKLKLRSEMGLLDTLQASAAAASAGSKNFSFSQSAAASANANAQFSIGEG